jgi:hypothetical protein
MINAVYNYQIHFNTEERMKIEDLSGEASIRKGTKEIMVPLVGEEREAVTKDVYDADERKIRVETEKAAKNKVWNDEIKNEDLIIHNGCVKLKGGVLRKIETREYFFWDIKKVYVVRTDTGEVVGERPIKPEETFQDFTEPEMQVKPEDIPEEFKLRLLSFVPPPVPAIEDKRIPVETECTVVDENKPIHICVDCIHVDDQPGCREGLMGDEIKFIDNNPDAEIVKCFNFTAVSSDAKTASDSSDDAKSPSGEIKTSEKESAKTRGNKKTRRSKKSGKQK